MQYDINMTCKPNIKINLNSFTQNNMYREEINFVKTIKIFYRSSPAS